MSQHFDRRYDLSDLLGVVDRIDDHTTSNHLSSPDLQQLKEHSSLCTNLKREEVERERDSLSVLTDTGPSHRGILASSQPLRPPVSKFARTMWPDRSCSHSGTTVMQDEDTTTTKKATKITDFATGTTPARIPEQPFHRPRDWRSRPSNLIDEKAARTGQEQTIDSATKSQRPEFATARERQLYYRPKEWRQRRRGEWADTGPYLSDRMKEDVIFSMVS